MWTDLLSAVALWLIIEGLLPFLSPGPLRELLVNMLNLDDLTLRFIGLSSMILGLALLTFVRW